MPKTYEPISSQVLTGTQATITFSSIPQTYTDLVLVTSIRSSYTTGDGSKMTLNSDTGTNYSQTRLYANASVNSDRTSNSNWIDVNYNPGADSTAGIFGLSVTHFLNYSNTTTFKPMITRWSNMQTSGTTHTALMVSMWRSTNAISTITITPYQSTTFAIGSTFTLYGIKAA